ncbi:MAG: TraB/GumN family protein [Cellvibrionaceae bacterium]
MKIVHIVFISFLLGPATVALGQEANSQNPALLECADPSSSLLWEVKGKNSTVYLFGSLHLGNASFYPLHEKIESALRGADHVVFEVDPRSMTTPQAMAKIQQLGSLAPGEKLSDFVSEPVINKFKTTVQELGLPPDNFMNFRPWFLTLILTSLQMTSMGYIPEYGVENYVLRETQQTANILELESLDEQLGFLEHLDGEAFLAYTLSGFEAGKQKIQLLVDAWRCADKPQLVSLFRDEFDVSGAMSDNLVQLEKALLTDRNKLMADKIQAYLHNGEGSYFVVVGAAHYIGEGSVVELLRAKDHEVEAIRL